MDEVSEDAVKHAPPGGKPRHLLNENLPPFASYRLTRWNGETRWDPNDGDTAGPAVMRAIRDSWPEGIPDTRPDYPEKTYDFGRIESEAYTWLTRHDIKALVVALRERMRRSSNKPSWISYEGEWRAGDTLYHNIGMKVELRNHFVVVAELMLPFLEGKARTADPDSVNLDVAYFNSWIAERTAISLRRAAQCYEQGVNYNRMIKF